MMWLKRAWFAVTEWLGLWPLWCRIYQWIWERKLIAKDYALWGCWTPQEVAQSMSRLKWVQDGWRELWDAAHHPAYVSQAETAICEANGLHTADFNIENIVPGRGQPEGSMDCEDFALTAATALYPRYLPTVLCVFWSTGRWPWQMAGHAVCLYYKPGMDRFGYLGNWPHRFGFNSSGEVVNDILGLIGLSEKDLVAVRAYDPKQLRLAG